MVEAVERRGAVSIRVDDESGTKAVARRFAALVRRGDVIGLSGPLGSGKTAFARALIRTLTRAEEEVPSPTFTLVQRYESAAVGAIFHFDLYRLEDPEEIWELGIEEAVTEGVVLISWTSSWPPIPMAAKMRGTSGSRRRARGANVSRR
jgi:tRNA threonylcarbamoyladenosine biosynthesis protein TsaE